MESKSISTLFQDVFRPDKWKLLLGALAAFISLAGATQTYVFVDDVPGMEPPPLYPYIRGLDFWIPWLILTIPIWVACMPGSWCGQILEALPSMGSVKIPVFSVAFGYLEASWTLYVWERWVRPNRLERPLILATIALTAIIYGPSLIASLMGYYPLSLSISGTFLSLFVIWLHTVSVYGLYKLLTTSSRKSL